MLAVFGTLLAVPADNSVASFAGFACQIVDIFYLIFGHFADGAILDVARTAFDIAGSPTRRCIAGQKNFVEMVVATRTSVSRVADRASGIRARHNRLAFVIISIAGHNRATLIDFGAKATVAVSSAGHTNTFFIQVVSLATEYTPRFWAWLINRTDAAVWRAFDTGNRLILVSFVCHSQAAVVCAIRYESQA